MSDETKKDSPAQHTVRPDDELDAAEPNEPTEAEVQAARTLREGAELRAARAEGEKLKAQKQREALDSDQRLRGAQISLPGEFKKLGLTLLAPTSDAWRLFTSQDGVEVVPAGDNGVLVNIGGEKHSLAYAVKKFASENSFLFDAPLAQIESDARASVTAKSDLHSAEQKSQYISKHGAAAFLNLPPERLETNPSRMDLSDLRKLNHSQRAELAAKVGEGGIAEIVRRGREATINPRKPRTYPRKDGR
jgi:hypothetical protein